MLKLRGDDGHGHDDNVIDDDHDCDGGEEDDDNGDSDDDVDDDDVGVVDDDDDDDDVGDVDDDDVDDVRKDDDNAVGDYYGAEETVVMVMVRMVPISPSPNKLLNMKSRTLRIYTASENLFPS